jgi:hypothetical protein
MYPQADLKDRNFLFADAFRTVYDDEPATPPAPSADGEGIDPPPANDGEFSREKENKKTKQRVTLNAEQQAFVNSLLAEERRKAKAATDKVITQLETLKNQAGTTQAEKETLEQRIEELKNTQLTQEELRKKEDRKREEKWVQDLAASKKAAEHWQTLFTTTTIQRELTQAASTQKAYNPRHVVNELAPRTRLVDELDPDGKPTGNLVPRVKISTVVEGKPATMDMTVTEAVRWMSEQDEHAPLFNSGATGGLGGHPNNPSRRGRNADEPPTDPNEYVEWRKKNRGFSGAPKR